MTEAAIQPPPTIGAGSGTVRASAAAVATGVTNRRLWGLQAAGFALLIAALAAILAMSRRSGEADAWVAHSLEVRRASSALFSRLQDAEANVRALLLVGDRSTIARYEAARDALPAAQTRLHLLTQDSTTQTARLDALDPLIAHRMSVLGTTVEAHRGDGPVVADLTRPREGAIVMDQIRATLATFDQAEVDLLADREAAAQTARTELLLGSTGALSLALVLGGFTSVLSQRQTRALHLANAQLTGTVSDRTDALRESEVRFRQVFNDSPIGLTIATAEGRCIIAANPAACRLFGYSEAELIGRTSRDLAHPDDAEIVVPVSSDAGATWRPTEKRYLTRSGAMLYARAGSVPLGLASEAGALILGTTEDITHEKAIEAALRETEVRMRLAIEAIGLGVWERDLQQQTMRLDVRAAALSGGHLPVDVWLRFDGPELTSWRATIHPDDAAQRDATAQALTDDHSDMLTDEYRVRRGDGGWAWISTFSTVAERDPDTGQPLRLLTVGQDVTQRKETEIELRHAQRMEAIGQLTGGVAHDFNNLLGAILGHSEFLLDLLTEHTEAHELATEILDCAMNGAALTQRLLAFARRQPLQPAVIDLNEYVPVQVSLLQRTLGETVTVEIALRPGLWLTHADPSQIVDVLLNLAINARDAMPHGGKLTIGTANAMLDASYCARHREAKPGEYVVLSVTDTGAGMTPEVLARAMEPFFTTKPPGKGSGLGLSTIYGFARQSGGYLSIDSEPGSGTVVQLYLPRTLTPRTTADIRQRRSPPLPRGNESILVVDDNAGMRETAARNLTALGYRVRLAEDGPTALTILHTGERFSLLFTDVVMPNGLSGYQLAEAAQVLQPDLPVLFTTGFAADNDGETGVMDPQALRKPYRRRQLAERVRAVLDR